VDARTTSTHRPICPVFVCGDFNIHVDLSDDKHAAQLLQLLQTFDMVQHVTEPTHVAGHTLHLVIARQDTTIDHVHVNTLISDHSLVVFTLRAKKPARPVQCVTSRAWRRLSMEDFASDLAASKLCTDLSNVTVDEMVQLYRRVTTELLDKHCPAVNVRRRARPMTPWCDAERRSERRRVRAAERRYRRTRCDVDKRASHKWRQLCVLYKR